MFLDAKDEYSVCRIADDERNTLELSLHRIQDELLELVFSRGTEEIRYGVELAEADAFSIDVSSGEMEMRAEESRERRERNYRLIPYPVYTSQYGAEEAGVLTAYQLTVTPGEHKAWALTALRGPGKRADDETIVPAGEPNISITVELSRGELEVLAGFINRSCSLWIFPRLQSVLQKSQALTPRR